MEGAQDPKLKGTSSLQGDVSLDNSFYGFRPRKRFTKNYGLVIQQTSQKLLEDAGDTRARLLRASAYVRQGDVSGEGGLHFYAKAVKDYDQLILNQKNDVVVEIVLEAHYYRGKAYQQLNNIDKAIADYSSALNMESVPSYLTVNAAYARASCYNMQGNFDKAIADYEKALMRDEEAKWMREESESSVIMANTPGSSRHKRNKSYTGSLFKDPSPSEADKLNGTSTSTSFSDTSSSHSHGNSSGHNSSSGNDSAWGARANIKDTGKEFAWTNSMMVEKEQKWQQEEMHWAAAESSGAESPSDEREHKRRRSSAETENAEGWAPHAGTWRLEELEAAREFSEKQKQKYSGSPQEARTPSPPEDRQAQSRKSSQQQQQQQQHLEEQSTNDYDHPSSETEDSDCGLGTELSTIIEDPSEEAFESPPRERGWTTTVDAAAALQQPPSPCPSPMKANVDRGNSERARKSHSGSSQVNPSKPDPGADAGHENRKNPSNEHYSEGMQACQKGEFQQAVFNFEKALASAPSHFEAQFNQGFALHQLGRIAESILAYTKAVQLNPGSAFAFYNRGIARDRKGQYQLAVEDFSTAIKLAKESGEGKDGAQGHKNVPPDFYHNRGYSFKKMGKLKPAVKDYSRAIKLKSDHFKAYINRALAFEQLAELVQKSKKAENDKEDSVRKDQHKQYLERSAVDYTRALQIRPKSVVTLEARCLVLQKLKQSLPALKDVSRAIAIAVKQKEKLARIGIKKENKRSSQSYVARRDKLTQVLSSLLRTRAVLWPTIQSSDDQGKEDAEKDPDARRKSLEDFQAALALLEPFVKAAEQQATKKPSVAGTLSTEQAILLGNIHYDRGTFQKQCGALEEAVLDCTAALSFFYASNHTVFHETTKHPHDPFFATANGPTPPPATSVEAPLDLGVPLKRICQQPSSNTGSGAINQCRIRVCTILSDRARLFQQLGYLSQATVDLSGLLRLAAHMSENVNEGSGSHLSIIQSALTSRAYVYAKQNKFKRACQDYSFLVALDPQHVYAYFNRALCYEKNKHYGEAIDDFTKVIILGNNNFVYRAHQKRGELYSFLGRQDLASKDKRQLAKLDSKASRRKTKSVK